MPELDWDVFKQLSGAADENFEKLCRSLIRRHYGRFGRFKQLANQPGVEFHLELNESCDLGEPPDWIGWQCKWYQLSNGEDLGATRRQKIIEGLQKTCNHLPGVTNWKLWTRHTLTKQDQMWFFDLENSQFPKLKLELLTAADIEDLLVGPGALLRETYFGELVLTPELLAEQYRLAAAPFKRRYQQEVHVVVGAEEKILQHMGVTSAWESLEKLSNELKRNCGDIFSLTRQLKVELIAEIDSLLARASQSANLLSDLHTALGKGDFDALQQMLEANPPQLVRYDRLLSKLRGARSGGAPLTANLVADMHAVSAVLFNLKKSIGVRAVAVLAAAGEGKSELSVNMTKPNEDLLGGVLLLGKNLHVGQRLDDLASTFKISGRPAESFEQLVEAVDAAGQRAGQRIPIIIDGLNEAEDPRNWRDELARAEQLLEDFPYVLLVVTLRNEFAQMCLPEEILQIEHKGFQENLQIAIEKYFEYYKIDATDADLPTEFLQHPLTLRVFCEVANPRRQHVVGVEALPNSLVGLFEAHFNKVAERVAELSPAVHRIYQEEVQDVLLKIAGLLWESNTRSVEFQVARTAVGDVGRWDASIIRALESEGILIRTTSGEDIQGIAFSYDLMAGHMMARYLINKPSLVQWLKSDEGRKHFQFSEAESHTFAYDVLRALVGLYPQRPGRRQLWQDMSDERLVMNALLLTTYSDPKNIGRETVERFAHAMQESKKFAQIAFDRLMCTRAAQAHPFDINFLHNILLAMPNTQRDLFWSEWVRENTRKIEADCISLSSRWKSADLNERDIRRARWVMWVLTSTSRKLRDQATKTLYEFAIRRPVEFFQLTMESIKISDPYVPERIFAAAYGAALTTWSDLEAVDMRKALPGFARDIYQVMFAPNAKHPTWHALYQHYCLGIISIARMVDGTCLSEEELVYLVPPFNHLPNPFDNMPLYDSQVIESARSAAISMDFGNYTIGRLIPRRSNYDFDNPEYQRVRTAIVSRMLLLGYEPQQFKNIDEIITKSDRSMGDVKHKIDRYGKKYSWIAYFEMWGVRHAQNLLRDPRSSDVDIDPTFPVETTSIDMQLPDLFSDQPTDIGDWVVSGSQPDYRNLLEINKVDGLAGPWVALDGFIQQNAPTDDREVFTFLRGVLVDNNKVEHLCSLFTDLEYPGNDAVPKGPEYYYTYAGEMPFFLTPGQQPMTNIEEDEYAQSMVSADRWSDDGIAVDIPVQTYNWESYHSELNQTSNVNIPSKMLCETLGLKYRTENFDLYDDSGVASLYRKTGEYGAQSSGFFCYLRRDLLDNYLAQSGKVLVWLMWGERGLDYRSAESINLHEHYKGHQNIHKSFHIYQPASNTLL